MRSFNLYVKYKNSKFLITEFDSNKSTQHYNPYSTFNEKLNEKENDLYEFSFSIAKYCIDNAEKVNNQYANMLKLGSELILILDDIKQIDFIIKKITPKTNKDNTIFDISCQDKFSWLLTKHYVGYSYKTKEVLSINRIVQNIINDTYLKYSWYVEGGEEIYNSNSVYNKSISLDIENSNPYNAIIEACNTINCWLKVNFHNKSIGFLPKDNNAFSGYRYRPDYNLQSFSANYDSNNLTTILHVAGGENEFRETISLIPPVPFKIKEMILKNPQVLEEDIINWNDKIAEEDKEDCADFIKMANNIPNLGQFLYDFSYFHDCGFMSDEQLNEIKTLFNKDIRNNNYYLKIYNEKKYKLEFSIDKIINNLLIEGEKYQAETSYLLKQYNDDEIKNISNEKLSDITNNMHKIVEDEKLFDQLEQLYGTTSVLWNIEKIKELKNKEELFLQRLTEKEEEIEDLNKEIENTTDEKILIDLNSELNLAKQNRELLNSLAGEIYTNDNVKLTVGMYTYLLQILDSCWKKYKTTSINKYNSLLDNIKKYENKNKELWNTIYTKYGNYIYESKYENNTELNSESLYLQANQYFISLHHPSASYSAGVLDLELLEQVGLPRLEIGNVIRIYNKDINLGDEKNNISYTKDDLIITNLNFDLRNPIKVSINVQKNKVYEDITEKLLKLLK